MSTTRAQITRTVFVIVAKTDQLSTCAFLRSKREMYYEKITLFRCSVFGCVQSAFC